jgi:hypothetical protein
VTDCDVYVMSSPKQDCEINNKKIRYALKVRFFFSYFLPSPGIECMLGLGLTCLLRPFHIFADTDGRLPLAQKCIFNVMFR